MSSLTDYAPISCWIHNKKVYELIEKTFEIVDVIHLNLSPEIKLKKLRELYSPHTVHANDQRVTSQDIVKIFIVKLTNPSIEIKSRNEHIDIPLYVDLVRFKERARALACKGQHAAAVIHTPDWLNESNHFLKVFDLKNWNVIDSKVGRGSGECRFFKVDELMTVRWLEKPRIVAPRTLKRVEDSPHFHYIIGNKHYYESYIKDIDTIHDPKARKFGKVDVFPGGFNSMLKKLKSDIHKIENILVYRHPKLNVDIIYDGAHRCSIYRANNIKYIRGSYIDPSTEEGLLFDNYYVHEHYYEFEKVMHELDRNNIRYTIIRGYKTLPQTPDSDLDIVCHPEDFRQLHDIFKDNFIMLNQEYFKIENIKCEYAQFRTNGIPDHRIKNTYFHIDIYNGCFTTLKHKINLGQKFLETMFENSLRKNCYYVPDSTHEYFLLLVRMLLDCSKVKSKHLEYLKNIAPVDKVALLGMCNYIKDINIRNYFLNSIVDLKF